MQGDAGSSPVVPLAGEVTRRRFFTVLLNGLAALVGAALAVPAVAYILSPARRVSKAAWAFLGNVEEFPLNQPKLTHFAAPGTAAWMRDPMHRAVYVVNRGEGQFTVYDVHCTHLGCPVQYNAAVQRYFSPCHGGVFDFEGRILAGPPPRPLDRYEVKVDGGKVYAGLLYRVDERLQRLPG